MGAKLFEKGCFSCIFRVMSCAPRLLLWTTPLDDCERINVGVVMISVATLHKLAQYLIQWSRELVVLVVPYGDSPMLMWSAK